MKIYITFILVILNSVILKSQSISDSTWADEEIHVTPTYPGGMKELSKFIKENLKQPSGKKVKGTVFVSFVIDTSGILKDFKIQRGLGEKYDKEAIRVIELSGPWLPGKQYGVKVPVGYTLPISFNKNG